MSFENEGLVVTWEDIKKASRRLDWGGKEVEEKAEKRVVRRYLAKTDCEDARIAEHIAIPGYN
ncbi:MAG: hypothetical protein KDJ27_04820 [Gammaproteobacteria bacterium]|nr:hypothetical protein [Gammaproteobacteria bacterium]